MNKLELRKNAKTIRKNLNIDEISYKIAAKIEKLQEFENSRHILLFYPTQYEINLLSLCEKYCGQKQFYLPKVRGENLVICPFECGTPLKISQYNIFEPCGRPISPQTVDFAIIPCLCADKRGYRIGYGGGFYDRFLPRLKENCVKIIPVPQKLLFDEVPTDTFDIAADYVVTEQTLALN